MPGCKPEMRSVFMSSLVVVFSTILLMNNGFAQDETQQWRVPDAGKLAYIETSDGRIIIELNTDFAPQTAAQFTRLVKQGFYDGLRFYRVIDGFVAQGGDGSDLDRELSGPMLPAEFEIEREAAEPFVSVQTNDLFAAETGFVNGFAVARDNEKAWLTHCPGVVAMARDNDPASGSTDFYIVIGQAPRYLDRNLTIFGRVVAGMDIVQKINRGPRDSNGIIEDKTAQTVIKKAVMAVDIPEKQRQSIQVMNTRHEAFTEVLDNRRYRTSAFFHHTPPAVLDVCQVPVPSQ